MTTLRLALFASIAGVLLSPPQQQPSRDAVAPRARTGVITGTVMLDDATPRPIRRASVVVTGQGGMLPVQTFTDDAGRFSVGHLPPGRYTVKASKNAYVDAGYGAPRPGLPGAVIVLADGQTYSATIRMLAGAVVSGTIRSPMGRPVSGVTVEATPFRVADGERLPTSGSGDLRGDTDDRGEYRIYGLPPGTYLVQAEMQALGVGGVITQPADAAYEWAARRMAANAGPASSPAPPADSTATYSYAPVFYPGVVDAQAASPIVLAAGEERLGLDVQLRLAPTSRVVGTVVDDAGHPVAGAQIMSGNTVSNLFADFFYTVGGSGGSAADGQFTLNGLAPGQYMLLARGPAARPTGPPVPGITGAGASPRWASTEISVNGQDVTGVTLTLRPGLKVSGRIAFEPASAAPAVLSEVTVQLASARLSGVSLGVSPAPAARDGTFVIDGVTPGPYWLFAMLKGSVWTLKSAMIDGRDVLDIPFDVGTDDVSGVVVTYTNRPSEIAGRLLDGTGAPAPQFYVQVFPVDRALWTPRSRRVKNVRAATDGRYSFKGLPAGEYYICALSEYDEQTMRDPSFLEELVAASYKLTLPDGGRITQDLRLAGGG